MTVKKKASQSKLPLVGSNQLRPPVVAVLGHVDHGKTSLLSVIREFDLTKKEYGGITQHIGAYQIEHQKQKITFIDTPGHAAFIKMRSYGAQAADLVVLVIAADDGVKPQTKESLKLIKQAKTPFLVAINKIDLPQASVERVKAQLAENDVLVEGYGGEVVCIEVSAKEKKGISELLEMILLLAQFQELKAKPKKEFKGVIIDSKLDSRKGPLASVLVKEGTLKLGQKIYAQNIEGKVKLMLDEKGDKVNQAEPSKPVLVLGFKQVPEIGVKVEAKPEKNRLLETSQKIAEESKSPPKASNQADRPLADKKAVEEKKLKIILKADTKGTLEAIQGNLSSEIEIISAGLGQITESDVLLCQATQALILGFNVKTPPSVKKLAEQEKVKIKTHKVIYELLEDLEKKVLQILEPTIDEEILGEAEVIAEFKIKGNHIAGCRIIKGRINKKDKLHLKRKGKIIVDLRIKSFQQEKKEVEEAKAGTEVGIVFSSDIDFRMGDVIIAYK